MYKMSRKQVFVNVACFLIMFHSVILYVLCFARHLYLDVERAPSRLKDINIWQPLNIETQYGLGFNLSCADDSVINEDKGKYLKNALSEQAIIDRTDNCDEYFKSFHVEAVSEERSKKSNKIILAVSHQVHEHIGIFEAFLAIIFRSVRVIGW